MKGIFVKDRTIFLFIVVFDSIPTNESGEVFHDDIVICDHIYQLLIPFEP